MEGLHTAIDKAVDNGRYKGMEIGVNKTPLTHLFFADDAVYFGEWSIDNALNLVRILYCFQRSAGLSVNLDKSSLYDIGKEKNMVETLALVIGCKAAEFPSTFLGMTIGINMGLKRPWESLITKFKKKLSNWKAKTLSIGGRHTLVSNVLGSLGTFLFSLFKAPAGVLRELERIRKGFFWGCSDGKKRIPWVQWEKVLTNKENGGLGIISLKDLNLALLAKWYWRYRCEPDALWVQIIDSIHGKIGDGEDYKVKTGHNWRRIIQGWNELRILDLDPRNLCKKEVGDGLNTSFWEEWWIGEKSLKLLYPRLYNLESVKGISVNQKLNLIINEWNGRTELREGRTKSELDSLKILISNTTCMDGKVDKWRCPDGHNGVFSVSWLRKQIAKKKQGTIGKNFWSKWVPKRCNVFVWKASLNRVAVKEVLNQMGIHTNAVNCDICKIAVESPIHVFLYCSFAQEVWSYIDVWWSLNNRSVNSVADLFMWLENQAHNKMEKKALFVIGAATLVALWQHRNEFIFLNHRRNAVDVFRHIQKESFLWIDSRASKICIDRNAWVFFPRSALSSM